MDYLCQQEGGNSKHSVKLPSDQLTRGAGGAEEGGDVHSHMCFTDREHEQQQGNRRSDAAS